MLNVNPEPVNGYDKEEGIAWMNILLVDDEMEELRGLRMGLGVRGYQVHETLSAEQAMECLENAKVKIDMVITDYVLPDMNGMELVKAIRAKDQILPIILMTGRQEEALDVEALHGGCDGYIEKPFTLDELMDEVERIKRTVNTRVEGSGAHGPRND
jgi:two-component system KDP operon response regulator KdpE